MTIDTFLFDFDGTLVDTAPDLNRVVNHTRQQLALQPLSEDITRPIAGHGAKALIASGNDIDAAEHDRLAEEMFQHYEQNIHEKAVLFEGMSEVLKAIHAKQLTWGIVTNRPEHLTHQLLPYLNLPSAPACIVCGDTLEHAKPHPAPVIHAYELLNKTPEQCLLIGDSIRDIQAGIAAKVKTAKALYGYIPDTENPNDWPADYAIKHPSELLDLIKK